MDAHVADGGGAMIDVHWVGPAAVRSYRGKQTVERSCSSRRHHGRVGPRHGQLDGVGFPPYPFKFPEYRGPLIDCPYPTAKY